jgi:hypothetical protein
MNETLVHHNRTVLGGQAIKAQLYIPSEYHILDKNTRIYYLKRIFMTFSRSVCDISLL